METIAPAAPAAPPAQPAGLFRRASGFLIDFLITLAIALLLMGIAGLIFPLDEPLSTIGLAAAVIGGFSYLFAAPIYSRSVGKFVAGTKIVNASGGPPSLLQCFLRFLTIGLWPIEGLLVLFSKTKRRLGDRLAGTSVVNDPGNTRPWFVRAGAAAALVAASLYISFGAMGLAASRTGIFHAAVDYLGSETGKQQAETEFGAPAQLDRIPRNVTVENDSGLVVIGVSGSKKSGFVRLAMSRRGEAWSPDAVNVSDTAGSRGYSFSSHH